MSWVLKCLIALVPLSAQVPKYLSAHKSLNVLSIRIPEGLKFQSALREPWECPSTKVPSEYPNTRVLSECLKFLNTFSVSLYALYEPKCLIRLDWNKVLCIKRCFMHMNTNKNGREDFEELNFEVESERLFKKL